MTGEMSRHDLTLDEFPVHFAVAEALGATVEPFDVYQGPYVCVGPDIRCGSEPYQLAPRGLGVVRLWLVAPPDNPDGYGPLLCWWNEATECYSNPFWFDDYDSATEAAREVVA